MRILILVVLLSSPSFALQGSRPGVCELQFVSNSMMSDIKWAELEENYVEYFKDFLHGLRIKLGFAIQEKDVVKIKEAQSMLDRVALLGFVNPGSYDEPWEIPSLKDFEHHFLALSEENRLKWNLENPNDQISNEQLIYPGYSFYNEKTKKWVVLRLGDEIPAGFEYNTRKLVPGKVLYPAISKGLFPLMLQAEDVGKIGAHDFLGHFSSYALWPDYARSYRSLAQRVQQFGGWRFLRVRNPMFERVTYFNEFHAGVDGKVLDELLASFGLEIRVEAGEHDFYSYESVYDQVKSFSNRRLRRLLKALSENRFSFLQLHGGVASDRLKRNYQATVLEHYMEVASEALHSEFFSVVPGFSLTDIIIKRKSPQAVAFLITLALNYSLLSNKDWEQAIALIEYPEHTRLGYIFERMNLPELFFDDENEALGFQSFFRDNWWKPLTSPNYYFMTMNEKHEHFVRLEARREIIKDLLDEAKERFEKSLKEIEHDSEARQKVWDAYEIENSIIMNQTPLPPIEEAHRILRGRRN